MDRMTDEEIETEWKYRFEEFLGICCGFSKPTKEQMVAAADSADEWESRYRSENPATALPPSC
jgi:hypothetical protein